MTSWAVWLALAALISFLGKFYDDYHTDSATKDRWRARLIRFFVWLDAVNLPDVPRAVQRLIAWPLGGRKILRIPITGGILLVLGYAGVIATFFVAGGGASAVNIGLPEYMLTWASSGYWVAFIGWMLVGTLGSATATGAVLKRMRATQAAWRQMLTALLAVAASLGLALVVFIGLLLGFKSGGYLAPALLLASIVAISPGALLGLGAVCLALTRATVGLLKTVLQRIADAASHPKNSPFTYGSALLSLLVLVAKVFKEILP